jgi:site-specific DNA-adenine methylase
MKKIEEFSLIKRFGNKRQLLKNDDFTRFFPHLNKTGNFIDMFCGTGVVTFRFMERMKARGQQARFILNDKDDELIQFFEVLQKKTAELENQLTWRYPGSERIMEVGNEVDAAIQFYLGNQDSTSFDKPVRILKDFERFRSLLDFHNVQFTNKDYKRVFGYARADLGRCQRRRSRKTVVILYCDPPYDNVHGYDKLGNFNVGDFLDDMNNFRDKTGDDKLYIFISLNKTDLVEEKLDGWYRKELNHYKKRFMRKERIEMLYSNHVIRNRNQANTIDNYFGDENK